VLFYTSPVYCEVSDSLYFWDLFSQIYMFVMSYCIFECMDRLSSQQ
jgi:hypothetical protein